MRGRPCCNRWRGKCNFAGSGAHQSRGDTQQGGFSGAVAARRAPRILRERSPADARAARRARHNVFRYFRSEYRWARNRAMSPADLYRNIFRQKWQVGCELRAVKAYPRTRSRRTFSARARSGCVLFIGDGAGLMAQFQAEELFFQIVEAGGHRGVDAIERSCRWMAASGFRFLRRGSWR